MADPVARPVTQILDRLTGCGRVEETGPLVMADDTEHLSVDHVRRHPVVVLCQARADQLGALSVGEHLEQAGGVNDQHPATASRAVSRHNSSGTVVFASAARRASAA